MTDEIRHDRILHPQGLTTADLAEAGEPKEPTVRQDNQANTQVVSSGTKPDGGAAAGTGAAAARAKAEEELSPLFSTDEANNFRSQWDRVQVAFVDEPRQAVEDADRLIATTMKRLAEVFADERHKLEHQWDRGDNVSTEDLRLALRRYRSFFSRLLRV